MDYLTDIHCHLHEKDFDHDRAEVIARSKSVGIGRFICNSGSMSDIEEVSSLAHEYEEVIPCYGVHPWFTSGLEDGWQDVLYAKLKAGECGVGEIGLDGWRKGIEPVEEQLEVFRTQLAMARELEVPAMIHCLKAADEMFEVLKVDGGPRCGFLLHAYSGPWTMVEPLVKLGGYFSFSHACLASDRRKAHKVISTVPSERFLLESDSPDLVGPEAFRRYSIRRNDGRFRQEPANIMAALDGFASIRGERSDQLRSQIMENTEGFLAGIVSGR